MKVKFQDFKSIASDNFDLKDFYRAKYYSIFQQAFRFEGLSEGQNHFLKDMLWYEGSAMLFILEESKTPDEYSILNIEGSNQEGENLLLITPYATTYYNLYNEITECYPIKRNGATFIPLFDDGQNYFNNVNCVILYAHTSHRSIFSLIDFYIDKIVEVEKAIRMNVDVNKMPRLLVCSPSDKNKVEDLFDRVQNGEAKLFISSDDMESISNVLDNGTYVIDKLYLYKQQIENELLTFLGVDNVQVEKKERLINAEVESNNDSIEYHLNCFLQPLRDGCERVRNVLGYNLDVISSVEECRKREEQKQNEILEESEEEDLNE